MTKPMSPKLEMTTQAFVDGLAGSKPIQTLGPVEARAVLSNAQNAVEVKRADVAFKDVTLPIGPTGQTHIRVMRPRTQRACCRLSFTCMAADGCLATATPMTDCCASLP
jgi:hypothetical protein